MKKIIALTTVVAGLMAINIAESEAKMVKGYMKKNGTYVAPYERTAPDSNPYNNRKDVYGY